MDFSIKNNAQELRVSCIIIGVFESKRLSLVAEQFDKISKGYISSLLCCNDLEGKIGQTMLLYQVPNIPSERVLLVGCGKESNLNGRQYKKIINCSMNIVNKTSSKVASCWLTDLHVKGLNIYWKIRYAIEIISEALYTFNKLKTNQTNLKNALRSVIFNISKKDELVSAESAISHGSAIATGIKLAKDLGNTPPNICNPSYLSLQAHELVNLFSKNKSTSFSSIGKKVMTEIGMNAYLSVSQGSVNEPIMSIIEYKGNPNIDARPIVLIGKGMTFDSGGISIKSAKKMDEMKYDMCGAAAVYGAMYVALTLNLPVNIIGILAGCENMIDGRSFRPGDILTTLSGQTVEILNTDAEGRMILCDVLTYVERFNPDIVIDIATLTGACVVALGHHVTGLMSNQNTLAHELINAAEKTGDYVCRLPLLDEFYEQLESNFADLRNIGGRPAGAITAGCFLSCFARKYNWAHLDIAGTGWQSGKENSATGKPVAMISQFLLNCV